MSNTELPAIPGGWTTQTIELDQHLIHLTLPAVPDDFLDDPHVRQANRETDYMPYWAYLWPASRPMANLIVKEPWTPRTRALEIGTGVGLTGIAGLMAGLDLTFSDYDPVSIETAQRNAKANGFTDVPGLVLDWRHMEAHCLPPFDVIIGCEVIYEAGNHPLVLDVLDRWLSPAGVCWIGDPGRQYAPRFCHLAQQRGYRISLRDAAGARVPLLDGGLNFPANHFRLIEVCRALDSRLTDAIARLSMP